MEQKLIDAVRSEKCLYDLKHPEYNQTKRKNAIWKRIAKAMNLKDGNEAKRIWEKLRNNHRDALRRQKNTKPKTAPDHRSSKPWRYQESMAFLIPHMASRVTSKEIKNEDASQTHSDAVEIFIQENSMDSQSSEETNSPGPSTEVLSDPTGHKNSILNDFRSNENNIATRQESNNHFVCNNVKNDPLFHFFISMYETTKRLPPLSQHTIKTSVFSLVSLEESKNLQYSLRHHSSSTEINQELNLDEDIKYFSTEPFK